MYSGRNTEEIEKLKHDFAHVVDNIKKKGDLYVRYRGATYNLSLGRQFANATALVAQPRNGADRFLVAIKRDGERYVPVLSCDGGRGSWQRKRAEGLFENAVFSIDFLNKES